jgi:SagB-type dehydrogenase family enzyme
MDKLRYFLKNFIHNTTNFALSPQHQGVEPPPLEKPFNPDSKRVNLLKPEDCKNIGNVNLVSALKNRVSHREFSSEALTLGELSFLLWATQGIKEIIHPSTALRVVPSAGSRHALETYLCVIDIRDLESGLYRFLPVENQLLFEFSDKNLVPNLIDAVFGQSFVGHAPVVFIWTSIPYRMEWRYHTASHKLIALDAGHVCQNLYLACENIGAGTCAIGAYNQEKMDALLKIDGKDEFTIYLAPVGKTV